MGRWGVLAILCLARVSMGLHLQVVAAVAPFLIADLGLGYGEIGTLIGVFLLPGAVLSMPGGLISRRFGDTRALVGALVLLAVGTALLAASDGFWMAVVARLVAGAGGTLLTMQVAKIATDWFAGRELSTAIGILLGTFPLGIAAVMAGLPIVAATSGWRAAVWLIAASAVVTLVIVAAFLRDRGTSDEVRAATGGAASTLGDLRARGRPGADRRGGVLAAQCRAGRSTRASCRCCCEGAAWGRSRRAS